MKMGESHRERGSLEGNHGSGRVRLIDVAQRAGVSVATVSLVLSGSGRATEATRQRVRDAAEALGYRPDELARGLRTRRSRTVALIVPGITNPFYPIVAVGFSDAVGEAGYLPLICNTDGDHRKEGAYISRVLDRRVDGIALISPGRVTQQLGQAIATVPVVLLGSSPAPPSAIDPSLDLVRPDDHDGAYQMTRHLLGRGKRIAMVSGPPGTAQSRYDGYARAMSEQGLRASRRLVTHGDWTRSGGAAAMQTLLRQRPRLDGVFCGNDLMAIGALDTARAEGLSVPANVVVGGFDDIDAASLVTPSLTTVVNPAYETGHAAGQCLVERMTATYTGPGRSIVLPCKLVARESSSYNHLEM